MISGMAQVLRLVPVVPRETDISASIVDAIVRLGLGVVTRYNSGAVVRNGRFVRFNNAPGHSDLGGVLRRKTPGRAFYLEVKRPGKEPTPEQETFLEDRRACGAIAARVDSVEQALIALGFPELLAPSRRT